MAETMRGRDFHTTDWLILAALALVTVVVFWRVHSYDFTNIDDHLFVVQNSQVQSGLTAESVKWAFRSTWQGVWHPLTWLSYMVDREMSSQSVSDPPQARAYHVTNLVLHLACTLLLYLLLRDVTGFRWRSAFVAVLFAIHPLHVESVAWISERKDVLSTLYWLLTLLAYVSYSRRPGTLRYLLVVSAFALGLMSKPMLVSLPVVLLLMDVWPLARVRWKRDAADVRLRSPVSLVVEKVPLLAMSAASCVVTYVTMKTTGSIGGATGFTISERLQNVAANYSGYLAMTVWPRGLAPIYPSPGCRLPAWEIVLLAGLLVAVSAAILRSAGRHPYLAFGWLWYLVTLFPVSGIVEQGELTMADHWTYVPLIGVFIAVAWGGAEAATVLERRGIPAQRPLTVAAVVVVVSLMIVSYAQVGYWKDSVTLLERTVRVTSDNARAHLVLGIALDQRGDSQRALAHLREATKIAPKLEEAWYALGVTLQQLGNDEEAANSLDRAIKIRPDYVEARNNLGTILARHAMLDEAIVQFEQALRADPRNEVALRNLEIARSERAREHRP